MNLTSDVVRPGRGTRRADAIDQAARQPASAACARQVGAQPAAAPGQPIAMEEGSDSVSAEERDAALDAAVAAQMQRLDAFAQGL
jgi:hypothetical protein